MTSSMLPHRGTFILDQTDAPVLLISAGIGATPVLAMLESLAQEHSDREIWALHVARSGREHSFAAEARDLLSSLPAARAHVYYSRPGPNDLQGRDFDSAGRLTASSLADLDPPRNAEAYLCGPTSFMDDISAGLAALGFDVRGSTPNPSGRQQARRRASLRRRCGRPTHRRASLEKARRSPSPAAISPSRGRVVTAPCSNWPSPATYPSVGRAGRASARPARRPSSPGMSITTPPPLNLPRPAACSSAAHSPVTTSCSICDRPAVTGGAPVGRRFHAAPALME